MKKVIILLTFVLLLGFALAAYGESTLVQFEVNDGYVVNIPATASIGSNYSGTLDISFEVCHVDYVMVSVGVGESSYDGTCWWLTGTAKHEKIPYTIKCGSSTLKGGDAVMLHRNGTVSLNLSVVPEYVANAMADTYTDRLTFSIYTD